MVRKLKKDALELTQASLVLGVGASVVGQAGGNAQGLSALGGALPPIGTTIGAGAALGGLGRLGALAQPEKKRKKNGKQDEQKNPFL